MNGSPAGYVGASSETIIVDETPQCDIIPNDLEGKSFRSNEVILSMLPEIRRTLEKSIKEG